MSKEPDFVDLTTLLYVGPAIIHVDMFYMDELLAGTLIETNEAVAAILMVGGLIDTKGKITNVGNEAFACIDLIRYILITGGEMSECKRPEKKDWQYNLLRKGLGQQAGIQAVNYIDFLKTYIKTPLTIVLDICGGDGTYLKAVCDSFNSTLGILFDKHTLSARFNSDKYNTIKGDLRDGIDTPHQADLVIINEVIHLSSDYDWWELVMSSAIDKSIPKGYICVGEVVIEPGFDWRMNAYSDGGASLSMDKFIMWINDNFHEIFEDDINVLKTNTHWFTLLKKRN